MDPADALWIGGGQGSGKSSIARALAHRFDLQLYNVDHRVQAHVARAAPHPFHALSFDERWLDAEPEEMLRWFVELARDRLRLVLEDLAALPASPLAVVEGPQLFPSLVAPLLPARDQALFLVPRPDEQRARLEARGPMWSTSDPQRARAKAIERDLSISERFAREAAELGLTALAVDRPLVEMVELAVAHFAAAIERGPRAVDLPAIRRIENLALAEQVKLYLAAESPPVPEDDALPFSCECGTPGCDVDAALPLEEFEAVVAAGAAYDAHVGLSAARTVVREHDPRWAREFEREAERVCALVADVDVAIEHVGSTAVPGLAAKPIVDLALGFPDRASLERARAQLAAAGYEGGGDAGSEGGVVFARHVGPLATHHLHLVERGDPQWARYLRFRETLRADASARDRYAAVKRELAARFARDREGYVAAKSLVVDEVLTAAAGTSPSRRPRP